MTREEKIECLCRLRACLNDGTIFTPWNKQLTEALDETLKQEPFINKPCVSEKACEHDKNVVIDKIRAEIEQLPTIECTETRRIYIDADDFKENVLAILDKYKGESEG